MAFDANDDDWLYSLIREVEEKDTLNKLRRENRYAMSLIEVLWPHPFGLARPKVIKEVEKLRRARGLPMPAKFEEALQSAFQQYAPEYATFRKTEKGPDDALFYSIDKGRPGVRWAVDRDTAREWLHRKARA